MIMRAEYMNDTTLHNAYYLEVAQAAGLSLPRDIVAACRISTDPHFNDVALHRWDTVAECNKHALQPVLRARGDSYSLGTGVCAAKALARHLIATTEPERRREYYLGKCDYDNSGRKNCKAFIKWELKDGRFSMTAEIWNPACTDIYCGGQCVDTVAEFFPDDAKARRMVEIWRRWHLNDMRAGSPAQQAWLRANPFEAPAYPKSHYDVACTKLAEAGLNPDASYLHNGAPYKYGSAWLKEEIPADVIAEIESW